LGEHPGPGPRQTAQGLSPVTRDKRKQVSEGFLTQARGFRRKPIEIMQGHAAHRVHTSIEGVFWLNLPDRFVVQDQLPVG
jgi:hypothetical protein